jgi:pteridine reductase
MVHPAISNQGKTMRRALVTGAARRVGRSIALELAANRFEVAVHYHTSQAEAQATVAACKELGGQAFGISADLTKPEECGALVSELKQRWSSLDLLVNNASCFQSTPFEDIGLEDWNRMLQLHVTAPFLLSQSLLPLLDAADDGLIINLSDIGAKRPLSGYCHYSVSKAAGLMLTQAMAVELAPRVRCVGVNPGQVLWPEDFDPELRQRITKRIPLGRVGKPEEVATLVRFVATEGTYLNGTTIDIDGGLSTRY